MLLQMARPSPVRVPPWPLGRTSRSDCDRKNRSNSSGTSSGGTPRAHVQHPDRHHRLAIHLGRMQPHPHQPGVGVHDEAQVFVHARIGQGADEVVVGD